ncbi:MAG: CDP-diacylglycerol--serine O-phosphatidyltransferase [Spirochaetota bacterium]|nr:CDP-diacylglycerol--serine O-phosphatidyltransferase [Spirochaetota bacterium]
MTRVWIPNTITTGNLLLGFISVIFTSRGDLFGYVTACILILGAALLDGIDGPVARGLKVDSPIGKELDSLADCVTFGVAPGYLAYKTYLAGIIIIPLFGKSLDLGIFIASIFPICAAYRLARYNVNSDPNSFAGLPSPIAGVIIALIPISFVNIEIPKLLFAIFYIVIALLMVSTVKYSKPQIYLKNNIHGIKLIILIILLLIILVVLRQWIVLIFISLYIFSGIVNFIIQFIQEHKY